MLQAHVNAITRTLFKGVGQHITGQTLCTGSAGFCGWDAPSTSTASSECGRSLKAMSLPAGRTKQLSSPTVIACLLNDGYVGNSTMQLMQSIRSLPSHASAPQYIASSNHTKRALFPSPDNMRFPCCMESRDIVTRVSAAAIKASQAQTASERHAPYVKRARLRIADALQRLIDRDVPLRARAGT